MISVGVVLACPAGYKVQRSRNSQIYVKKHIANGTQTFQIQSSNPKTSSYVLTATVRTNIPVQQNQLRQFLLDGSISSCKSGVMNAFLQREKKAFPEHRKLAFQEDSRMAFSWSTSLIWAERVAFPKNGCLIQIQVGQPRKGSITSFFHMNW